MELHTLVAAVDQDTWVDLVALVDLVAAVKEHLDLNPELTVSVVAAELAVKVTAEAAEVTALSLLDM
jgi:hypothetical protein